MLESALLIKRAAVAFIVPLAIGYFQSQRTADLESRKPYLIKQLDTCIAITDAAGTIATTPHSASQTRPRRSTSSRILAIFDNGPIATTRAGRATRAARRRTCDSRPPLTAWLDDRLTAYRHSRLSRPGVLEARPRTCGSATRPMSSESLIAYVNGEYVAKDQARISIFDFGFLRGDAVFDTTSAWNGRIFKLPAHLERLELSLRAARIPCPLPSRSCAP